MIYTFWVHSKTIVPPHIVYRVLIWVLSWVAMLPCPPNCQGEQISQHISKTFRFEEQSTFAISLLWDRLLGNVCIRSVRWHDIMQMQKCELPTDPCQAKILAPSIRGASADIPKMLKVRRCNKTWWGVNLDRDAIGVTERSLWSNSHESY